MLDDSMRWPDANHNLARKSAEDQRSRKNQSDQPLKHNTPVLFLVSIFRRF
jgi:hypothetical protein